MVSDIRIPTFLPPASNGCGNAGAAAGLSAGRVLSMATAMPTVGGRYRLPSGAVVQVLGVWPDQAACRYVRRAWPGNRQGFSSEEPDLTLSLGFLRRCEALA